MKGIIIYRSNYGSTKQYAEWIREETGFPLFDSRHRPIPWDVDTVVIGCPVMALRPALAGWMVKHWDKLSGKRVFLFTASGADPAEEPMRESIEKALPEPVRQGVRLFPLAGRFDFAALNRLHKLVIRMVALFSAPVRHQVHHPADGVARANLKELLAAIKGSP